MENYLRLDRKKLTNIHLTHSMLYDMRSLKIQTPEGLFGGFHVDKARKSSYL